MSVEVIGVITLVAGFASLRLDPRVGFRILVVSMLLGSAAAFVVPGLGTIQPAHLMLGFVLTLGLGNPAIRAGWTRYARFPDSGFWLLCTLAYCIFSAYFLPRFFAGSVDVNAVSSAQYVTGMFRIPLLPSSGNITQSVYFIGDVVCFFVCCSFADSEKGFRSLTASLMVYAIANIGFALLDIGSSLVGASFLLDFIRNSTYVIYTDSTVGNMKRIIGSFTEASAFANATIAIFCFSLRLWLGNVHGGWALFSTLASFILVVMSTSSTGYVALPICIFIIYMGSLMRIGALRAAQADIVFVIFIPLVLIIAVSAILLSPDLCDAAKGLLDTFIFNKGQSQSGIDRGRINVEGFQTFIDTNGLGAGAGSVRASSFIIACFANLGFIGTALFAGFIILMLTAPHSGDEEFICSARGAARCACIGLLISGSISGALIDLGLPFFVLGALSSAAPTASARALVLNERSASVGALRGSTA
ncbi:hypothetical protein [Beijerinckia sp. L45]|uniref:hypothetical protein n=1 Tax=Beijerinckia sp. L45 TaxID=1641855 RepID=UPI00131CFF92|nr:hypothetical protein [Beijerinckia sp. L45]